MVCVFVKRISLVFFISHFSGWKSVGNRVGVLEPFLMRMAHGAPMRTLNRPTKNMKELHGKLETRHRNSNNNVISEEQSLRVCRRFYVALILSRLVQVSHFFAFLPFFFFDQY